jgi:hypothetical protein
MVKDGLQRMDEKKTKHHIASHEFVLQDQIAQAAGLVRVGAITLRPLSELHQKSYFLKVYKKTTTN